MFYSKFLFPYDFSQPPFNQMTSLKNGARNLAKYRAIPRVKGQYNWVKFRWSLKQKTLIYVDNRSETYWYFIKIHIWETLWQIICIQEVDD